MLRRAPSKRRPSASERPCCSNLCERRDFPTQPTQSPYPDRVKGNDLKHVAVREHLRAVVAELPAGAPAPSERTLVAEFGVARMTVRQAIDALVADGLLERRPGLGTFVTTGSRLAGSAVLCLAEEMARRGRELTSKVLVARVDAAGPGVAAGLGIPEGASALHLRWLRCVDEGPLCVEDTYLDDALVPDLVNDPVPEELYGELARRQVRPDNAEDRVTAELATVQEAELLQIEPGQPVLQQVRRATLEGRTVLVSRTAFRSDRHALLIQFGRACHG